MSAAHFGRRISDKLDIFSLCLLGFIGVGTWVVPLTFEQQIIGGQAFVAVLAYTMRRWTSSLRAYDERREE